MSGRVEVIQSMSQYAHRLVAIYQGLAMRHDIYAIGKAAHDKHLGRELLEVGDEATDAILAVRGAVAGAHDVDYSLLVEVGIALVEEHQWGIVAFLQALWIALVVHADRLDAIFQVVFQFHFSSLPCLVSVLQGVDELV